MAEAPRVKWRLFCSPRELSVCSSRFFSSLFPKLSSFPLLFFYFSPYTQLSISLSLLFLVPTLPGLLSRDNYHYLSSLQATVCTAEVRSVKGRWKSIHNESKVINTHTHTLTNICTLQISDIWSWGCKSVKWTSSRDESDVNGLAKILLLAGIDQLYQQTLNILPKL